jgi:hypothetical protein
MRFRHVGYQTACSASNVSQTSHVLAAQTVHAWFHTRRVCCIFVLHLCCREWVVLGGTGQVGNGSTDMSLADAQKIADRAIQVRWPRRNVSMY